MLSSCCSRTFSHMQSNVSRRGHGLCGGSHPSPRANATAAAPPANPTTTATAAVPTRRRPHLSFLDEFFGLPRESLVQSDRRGFAHARQRGHRQPDNGHATERGPQHRTTIDGIHWAFSLAAVLSPTNGLVLARALEIDRISDDRTGHAVTAATPAPKLGAGDGDHLDAFLA